MPALRLGNPVELRAAFPEVVEPLKEALEADGELALAVAVDGLLAHALCGCGDSFCGSFYTADPARPRARGSIGLAGESPFIPFALDTTVDGEIAYLEFINGNSAAMSDFMRRYGQLYRQARASSRSGVSP